MIDSHCHLADRKFEADLPEVIERAVKAGVLRMITIADSLEESEKCVVIAEKYPEIFATAGVHPHHAKRWTDRSGKQLGHLLLKAVKVRALGEIGLDYHYDFSPRDTQRKVFEEQLRIAVELAYPVVVHCRDAIDDVWSIVARHAPAKLVLHCCTERYQDVERFLKQGYLLSFTGIATYPQAETIRDTIRRTPLERMMIETDAPYLAPVPHRGKRNEPAFVTEVAKLIAQLKGIELWEVDAATTKNAVDFYGLPS
jgi:TatD DNase family protein